MRGATIIGRTLTSCDCNAYYINDIQVVAKRCVRKELHPEVDPHKGDRLHGCVYLPDKLKSYGIDGHKEEDEGIECTYVEVELGGLTLHDPHERETYRP